MPRSVLIADAFERAQPFAARESELLYEGMCSARDFASRTWQSAQLIERAAQTP